MESIKEFSREYGHGRANYINGPLVAGASSLPAKAISPKPSTDGGGRAPSDSTGGVPGKADITVTSVKLQAASDKLQATSFKLQALGTAASNKR
jgi:hypothetical protein